MLSLIVGWVAIKTEEYPLLAAIQITFWMDMIILFAVLATFR